MPKGDYDRVDGNRMVASPDKNIVYSFGSRWSKKIFKFSCPEFHCANPQKCGLSEDQIQQCQWEELGTKLAHERDRSVAMSIPEDLANKLC